MTVSIWSSFSDSIHRDKAAMRRKVFSHVVREPNWRGTRDVIARREPGAHTFSSGRDYAPRQAGDADLLGSNPSDRRVYADRGRLPASPLNGVAGVLRASRPRHFVSECVRPPD